MVALRTPNDLPPPTWDGLPTRLIKPPDWQEFRNAPGSRGRALRELYESRLKTLGYRIGDRKIVTNTRRAPIYKLIFASRQPLGIKLWNEGCLEDPSGQIGMFLGWEYV